MALKVGIRAVDLPDPSASLDRRSLRALIPEAVVRDMYWAKSKKETVPLSAADFITVLKGNGFLSNFYSK
jgi:hypothetical protein